MTSLIYAMIGLLFTGGAVWLVVAKRRTIGPVVLAVGTVVLVVLAGVMFVAAWGTAIEPGPSIGFGGVTESDATPAPPIAITND